MPTKESFFYKPDTVEEIIGSRNIIPATNETLVDVIDSMSPGNAVVVDFDIIPSLDPTEGIPYYKEEDSSLKSMRFLKRGPQIDVMRYSSLENAAINGVQPYRDRNNIIKNADLGIPISGYGWWGIRTRQHRKVHLVDCVQGAKIFAFSRLNQNNPERTITMKEYWSGMSGDELRDRGADYLFEVPSTTEDMKHDVMFYSVPIAGGRQKFARILDMTAVQSSKAVTKRVTKRYAGRELYFGKHAIAAYIELAKIYYERGNCIPMQMSPFALPTQKTVDFYNRLEKRAMVQEDYITEKGNPGTRKRPLNKAEKEILLWRFVSKHGPWKTFFAREKIQEYKWNRMYEPALAV